MATLDENHKILIQSKCKESDVLLAVLLRISVLWDVIAVLQGKQFALF